MTGKDMLARTKELKAEIRARKDEEIKLRAARREARELRCGMPRFNGFRPLLTEVCPLMTAEQRRRLARLAAEWTELRNEMIRLVPETDNGAGTEEARG